MIVLQKTYTHKMSNKDVIITFQKILNKQTYLDSPYFVYMIRKLQMKTTIPSEEHVLLSLCGNETHRPLKLEQLGTYLAFLLPQAF